MSSFLNTITHRFTGLLQSIFPLYLCVFYLFLVNTQNTHTLTECLCFILSSFFVGLFGYLINDLFDKELDALANKKNMFTGISKLNIYLIFFIILGFSSLFWIIAKPSITCSKLLLFIFLLFIFYSHSAIRLKNNPILGPLCDAHYAHILPVLLSLYYLNVPFNNKGLLLIYVWLLCKGIRNIIMHQLQDRKGDVKVELKTFPLFFGLDKTLKILIYLILPLEVLAILALLFMYYPLTFPFILSLSLYHLFFILSTLSYQFYKLRLRYYYFKVINYLNPYYELWLPLTCIIVLNINLEYKLLLMLIHCIVYYKKLKAVYFDFKIIATKQIPQIIRFFVVLYISKLKYRLRFNDLK